MDPTTAQGITLEGVVAIITALVALVGVLVSVFTLANSARRDAFEQLNKVVTTLQEELEASKKLNETYEEEIKRLRKRIDDQDKLIDTLMGKKRARKVKE